MGNNQMKTLKLVAAIAALTGSMSVNAANVDLFTHPAGTTTVTDSENGLIINTFPVTTSIQTDDGGAGTILGGYRDMEVEFISRDNTVNTDASALVQMSSGGGTLSFDTATGVIGRGTLQWDGDDSAGDITTLDTMGMDEDITLDGADRFVFEVLAADLPFSFSVALYDTDGSSIILDLAANTGAHTSTILFDEFTAAFIPGSLCSQPTTGGIFDGGAITIGSNTINGAVCTDFTNAGDLTFGINFQHISALEVVINTQGGTTSLDMSIGSAYTTVPEPSSLALIGLGLMASGFASKRKAKKA